MEAGEEVDGEGLPPGLFAFGPRCYLCSLSLHAFEDAEEEEDGVPRSGSRTPHDFTGGCWTGTGKRSCRKGKKPAVATVRSVRMRLDKYN